MSCANTSDAAVTVIGYDDGDTADKINELLGKLRSLKLPPSW